MSLTTKPPASDGGRSAASPLSRPALDPTGRASRQGEPPPAAPQAGAAVRAPPDPAAALRILVAEVRAAVIEELVVAARLTPPALVDAEPGNAGAALLRWLRSAATLAGVDPQSLVPAFERGYLRAVDGLSAGGAPATAQADLALAREVVLGGLPGASARPAAATAPGVLLYRPDVAPPGAPRRPAADDAAVAARTPRAGDEGSGAAAADELQGALEAGRRLFEALRGGRGRAFADCWVYPAAVWAGGQWRGFGSAADCERDYAEFVATLGAAGLLPSRAVTLAVAPLGASTALIHAQLARDGSPGAGASDYPSVLTALQTAQGWRIAAWLLP